jgi:poly-beta-hydroxybutyrate-responsive repressor
VAGRSNLNDEEDQLGRGSGENWQPRNFVRPCLLLLLAESPDHGYDLVERLRTLGFATSEPPSVYNALRLMEEERLVTSEWKLASHGPARRVYSLTPAGRDLLRTSVLTLLVYQEILGDYLRRYRAIDPDVAPE